MSLYFQLATETRFYNKILLVLSREFLEAIKKKILTEIDITSWDTITEKNMHRNRYRGNKEGKPYNSNKLIIYSCCV